MLNIFGCSHSNTTFPMSRRTNRRGLHNAPLACKVVCLDCGKEFPYDWDEMKICSGKVLHQGKVAYMEVL